MKKLLLNIITIILASTGYSQPVSVSTGLGVIGSIDSWKVGTSTTVPAGAFTIPCNYCGIWEQAPVAGTNAKWISPTAAGNGTGMTEFIYEKSFSVPSGVKQLKCNFKVAADDVLKSVELIQPNNTSVALNFSDPGNGKFTKLITDSISCPLKGEWKFRVKVFCGDAKGSMGATALLVSGSIDLTQGDCNSSSPIALNPCCPPWNKDIMKGFMVYSGSGNISSPYTLLFQPTASFNNQMQAYINYLKTINPGCNKIVIVFGAHNQGSTLPAPGTYGTNPVGGLTWVSWIAGGNGTPVFSPVTGPGEVLGSGFPLQVGNWYSINSGIFLENGPRYFPKNCDDNIFYVRIQVMANKSASGNEAKPILEITDGKGTIQTIPIESSMKSIIGRGR